MVMTWVRAKVPASMVALAADRHARTTLIAALLALLAAGIDPPLIDATGDFVQANLRLYPAFQALVTLGVVAGAAITLSGGAVGDLYGRRRFLLGGLAVLALGDAIGAVVPGDPALFLSRALAGPAAGFIIPLALANIAVAFSGNARTTALGLASGVFGAAVAASPVVSGFLFAEADRVASLLGAAAAATCAWWLVRQAIHETDARREFGGREILMQVSWVVALLAIATGSFGVGDGPAVGVRLALVAGGLVTVGVVWRRRRSLRASADGRGFDVRPLGVAIVAGVVLAAIQAGPLLQMPLYLELGLGYPAVVAAFAVLPAIGAMLAATPLAARLLPRTGPRVLLVGSLIGMGLADLVLGYAEQTGGVLVIVLPLLGLGVGFTLGTTVRTAIVFSGVPRHLPATAAALNDTSIALGVAVGASGLTTYITGAAVATYLQHVPDAGADSVSVLRQALDFVAISGSDTLPPDLAAHLQAGLAAAYTSAAAQGVALMGLVGVLSGLAAWVILGRRDPLAGPAEDLVID